MLNYSRQSDATQERKLTNTVVFLFAHQDDEFGAFFAIEHAIREGGRVVCIYLTDGGFGSHDLNRRCTETLNVLHRLGVNDDDVHFIGVDQQYTDGALYTRLDDAFWSLEAVLKPLPISALYMHAWEGGHQDHDAVHLIGAAYAARAGLLESSRQFPMYRSATNVIKLTIFDPLIENGPVSRYPFQSYERLRYLSLAFNYPSQWKSWAVLLPLAALAYFKKPYFETQPVSLGRLLTRPHSGPLLYERFRNLDYSQVREAADSFLQRHIPHLI